MPEESLRVALLGDALYHPERWPWLEPASSLEELGDVVLQLTLSPGWRTLMHTLTVWYLLDEPEGEAVSAERQLGRQDVMRDLFRMTNKAIGQREHHGGSNGYGSSGHITGTG